MARNQVGRQGGGGSRVNASIGEGGGAKAHTPMQARRQAITRVVAGNRNLGRQFNASSLHNTVNMLAEAYHNVQVFQAPGAYGYFHALRLATAPRPQRGGMNPDLIGPSKQEELALERFNAQKLSQLSPRLGGSLL